jgi:RNA polymerase primary sigma factor
MAKERKRKTRGHLLSIEEGNDLLPFEDAADLASGEIVSSDQIDDVLMMFDEMDIDVAEDLGVGEDIGALQDEEKTPDKEDEGEGVDVQGLVKATDPVRMYLREMGAV